MKKLRSLHLYLGCIFAPMMLFFTVSGLWQTIGIRSNTLEELSTLHTHMALKIGLCLSNRYVCWFVILMAVSFIFSTVLGIIMAVKHGGSRRAAYACLAFGVLCPLALILIPLYFK